MVAPVFFLFEASGQLEDSYTSGLPREPGCSSLVAQISRIVCERAHGLSAQRHAVGGCIGAAGLLASRPINEVPRDQAGPPRVSMAARMEQRRMTKKVVLLASSICMVAMFSAVSSASAARCTNCSVDATSIPVVSGGSYDALNRLKVYGGSTATGWLTGTALYVSTVTGRTHTNTAGFRSYGYQWTRSLTGNSGFTLLTTGESGKGASYRPTWHDVGYVLRLRMSVCYQDPNDAVNNLPFCTASTNTPGLSWADTTQVVAAFASTNPVASFVTNRPNQIKSTAGVWQGQVPGSTKTITFQACTSSNSGCTNIATGVSKAGVNLTSAQYNRYIRSTVTLTTTQGNGSTSTAVSNSLGYHLAP